MKVTRGKKVGMNLAVLVNCVISTIPAAKRKHFRVLLLEEVRNYSFEPRKSGESPNSGCIHELDGIFLINKSNPYEVGKCVKEFFNIAYNKHTAKRMYDGFMEII